MAVQTPVQSNPHASRYLRCAELSVLVFGDHRGATAVEGVLAEGVRGAPAVPPGVTGQSETRNE